MVRLFRCWRIVRVCFQKKFMTPRGIGDNQSPCLIKGVPWPDDVVLKWRNDPKMFLYEPTILEADSTGDVDTQDINKQAPSRKYNSVENRGVHH